MPSQGVKKQKVRGPRKRQPTQFSQLDTTPTKDRYTPPEAQPFNIALANHRNKTGETSRRLPHPSSSAEDFGLDLSDDELLAMENLADNKHDPSNELEDLRRGAVHRSSSVKCDTPDELWDFGPESVPPASSPKSGVEQLPDTVPITQNASALLDHERDTRTSHVDFSETASTGRRSSPFRTEEAEKLCWELETPGKELGPGYTDESPLLSHESTPSKASPIAKSAAHGSKDEHIHDGSNLITLRDQFMPDLLSGIGDSFQDVQSDMSPFLLQRRPTRQPSRLDFESEKDFVASPPPLTTDEASRMTIRKSERFGRMDDEPKAPNKSHVYADANSSTVPVSELTSKKGQTKGKKRKQRAKSPVKFDESTQVVADEPKVKTTPPTRMPIITALQQNSAVAKSLISPVTGSGKRKGVATTRQSNKTRSTRAKVAAKPAEVKVTPIEGKGKIESPVESKERPPIGDAETVLQPPRPPAHLDNQTRASAKRKIEEQNLKKDNTEPNPPPEFMGFISSDSSDSSDCESVGSLFVPVSTATSTQVHMAAKVTNRPATKVAGPKLSRSKGPQTTTKSKEPSKTSEPSPAVLESAVNSTSKDLKNCVGAGKSQLNNVRPDPYRLVSSRAPSPSRVGSDMRTSSPNEENEDDGFMNWMDESPQPIKPIKSTVVCSSLSGEVCEGGDSNSGDSAIIKTVNGLGQRSNNRQKPVEVKSQNKRQEVDDRPQPKAAVVRYRQGPIAVANRTLSISEAGSPVRLKSRPLEKSSTEVTRENRNEDMNTVASASITNNDRLVAIEESAKEARKESTKQSQSILLSKLKEERTSLKTASNRRSQLAGNSLRLSMSDKMEEQQDGLNRLKSNKPPQEVISTRENDGVKSSSATTATLKLAAIREKIHADMVGSLQGQSSKGSGLVMDMRGNGASSESPSSVSNSNGTRISQQLHGIIKIVCERLEKAEGAVHRVTEAYKAGGCNAVERIRNRFDDEHQTLAKQ